jgi:hypothetical protein
MNKVKIVWLILCLMALALFTFADDITVKQTLGANVLPVINTATWTGTGWITQPGYSTHSTGTTALYPSTNPVKIGVKYLLEYTISNISTGTITASCGGVSDSARSTNGNFSVVITTTAETVLAFTPTNTCDGTVSNVSLRPYEGGNIRAYGNIVSEGTTTAKGGFVGSLTGAITGSGAAITAGTIKASSLQAAAADLGDADIAVNLTNSNAGNVTTLTIDGAMTAKSMVFENAETISNATDGTVKISGVTLAAVRQPVTIYNADGSETVDATMSGTTIVATKSDGATTVTIPNPDAATVGVVYEVLQTADQNLVVICTTADSNGIIADNVATSDQVSLATASHLIGGGIRLIGIQTAASTYKWFATAMSPTEPLTVEAAD